jgi:predicted nuclease of predicted toxin-antitoxin system
MRLLIDMNLTPTWVEFFALHGVEAVHWSSVGRATEPDVAIMKYAQTNGYVILTNDLDFGTLLAHTRNHSPSVILIRARLLIPRTIGQTILSILHQHQIAIDAGALIIVDDYRHKLRLLPI